jgi:cellulose biosynthesis protein BcsQ
MLARPPKDTPFPGTEGLCTYAEPLLLLLVAVIRSGGGRPLHIGLATMRGGAGKTTIAVHLAWLAAAFGLRVLVVDRDGQGHAHERLCGVRRFSGARPPREWAPGCMAVSDSSYSDLKNAPEGGGFDLIITDTRAGEKRALPKGVGKLDLVVSPVPDEESARMLLVVHRALRERPSPPTHAVAFVNVDDEDEDEAEAIEDLRGLLLVEGLISLPTRVPYSPGIRRAKDLMSPAWGASARSESGALSLRQLCAEILVVAIVARAHRRP